MNLIDTHCHLCHGRLYQQVQGVLDRARDAGVRAMICAVGDLHEAKTALALTRCHEDVYCMAGVHPHDAKTADEHLAGAVERLMEDPKCLAVGEIGLDYHYDFSERGDQRRVFAEQLSVARRLGAAVVLHVREAFEDALSLLSESGLGGPRAVFHSFTGNAAQASAALDLGATISFSGIVTFKRADDVRAAAAVVPDDRIMIETDAPYLSPEPVRKMKTNEPANVAHVADFLARLRDTTPEALAEQTTANAKAFFGLGEPQTPHPPEVP